MKTLLIIGVILMAGSFIYGTTLPQPSTGGISTFAKPKFVSYGILTGFVLIIISGVMYLRS